MSIVERLYDKTGFGTPQSLPGNCQVIVTADTLNEAAEEIFCLRSIVRDVRIMDRAGAFKAHEGEPWLLRARNIDLEK